jgi:hypothetical protein
MKVFRDFWKLKAIVFIGCYLYFPDLWYDS